MLFFEKETQSGWIVLGLSSLASAVLVVGAFVLFSHGETYARTEVAWLMLAAGFLTGAFAGLVFWAKWQGSPKEPNSLAELEESEARLRSFMDGSTDFITLVDQNFEIVDVDQKTLDAQGKKREEVLGANLRDLSKELQESPEKVETFRKIMRGESPTFYEENKMATPFGDRWLAVTVFQMAGGLGIVSADISNRKIAEEALAKHEQLLQAVFDALPHWLFVKDANRNYVMANQAMLADLGMAGGEVKGVGASDLPLGELLDQEVVKQEDLQVIERGEKNISQNVPIVLPNGRMTLRRVVKVPLRDETEKVIGLVGLSEDMTDQNKAEKMKNEFISTLSHELRTPLTSIIGSLGLLSGIMSDGLTPEANQLLEVSRKNSDHLLNLINDLLDIQKMESGKLELNLERIDLRQVVFESVEVNRGFGDRYHVPLEVVAGEDPVWVFGDKGRLSQVMYNLISNAVKYSPANTPVEITVKENDHRAWVIVRDEGPGIPESFYPQVFTKFSQADGSDQRKKEGTGLGLNITKAIVEAHQGSIAFHSRLKKGTSFFFDLPLYT